MKKILSTTLLYLFCISSAYCNSIDINKAKTVATNFYLEKVSRNKPLKSLSISSENITLQLAHQEFENASVSKNQSEPSCYVFNVNENNGFIIVSADDATVPVLGYSFSGQYNEDDKQPPAFVELMNHYKEQIAHLRANKVNTANTVHPDWLKYTTTSALKSSAIVEEVAPLISSNWDQGCYYNSSCPSDERVSCGHAYVGCVAVAMGQIMKYWEYPATGTDLPGYTDYENYSGGQAVHNSAYGAIPGVSSTSYAWNEMEDNLSSENTAVAEFLHHCGVAVQMNYGPTGSGAYSTDVTYALENYFHYQATQYIERENYSDDNWKNLIRQELNNDRPVYYRGASSDNSSGHAFVCDGYQNTDYFHFNWGWSGSYNSYFYIDNLTPGTHDFSYHQGAIIGITPGDASCDDFYIYYRGTTSSTTLHAEDTFDVFCRQCYTGSKTSSALGSSRIGYFLSTDTDYSPDDVYLDHDLCYLGSDDPCGNEESALLTIPRETGNGTWYILFVADYNEQFTEINEYNNVDYVQITVTDGSTGDHDFYLDYQGATTSTKVQPGGTIDVFCIQYYSGNTMNDDLGISYLGYYLSTDTKLSSDDIYLDDDYSDLGLDDHYDWEDASLSIPAGTSVGTYYILFVADLYGWYAETNENNNVESIKINVSNDPPGIQDFYISAQEVSSSTTVNVGGTIEVSCEQCYSGTNPNADMAGCYVAYYLSTDTNFDSDDIYLDDDYSELGIDDQCDLETATLTIPENTYNGTYYILFVADYDEEFSETNENNNVEYVGISVTGGFDNEDDFHISSQEASTSTTIQAGETIGVSCEQCYSGNASDEDMGDCYLGYYLSSDTNFSPDDLFLAFDYSSLGSDDPCDTETAILTIPAGTNAGTYYVLFVADYDEWFAEINENNNVEYLAITVDGGSIEGDDFYISSQQATTSTTISAGAAIGVSCEQCYSGNQTDAEMSSCYVGYFLSIDTSFDPDDVYLDYDYSGLGSDDPCNEESEIFTIPAETSPGNYYLLFVADYDNQFAETNEDNNVEYIQITVTETSPSNDDFYISNQQATGSTTVQAGGTIDVSCEQCYSGNTVDALMGSCYVGYYLSSDIYFGADDTFLDYDTSGLGSDDQCNTETETLTIPAGKSAGTYYLLFVADYDERFEEDNENNNVEYVTITVSAGVASNDDFYISNQEATSSTTVSANETINISCDQCYSGSTTDSDLASCNVGYFLSSDTNYSSDDIYLDYDASGLGSDDPCNHEAETITIPEGTSPGDYYILFVADYDEWFAETNEENNVAYVAITVSDENDFYINYIEASGSTTIPSGGQIDVSCQLCCTGNFTITELSNCQVGYFLSTDTNLGAEDSYLDYQITAADLNDKCKTLNVTLLIPSATGAGTYYLLCVADYDEQYAETIENNNVNYLQITISDNSNDNNDFYIGSYQATSSTAVEAEGTIDVSCEQCYAGTAYADTVSCRVGYYLSTDSNYDSSDLLLDEDASGLGKYVQCNTETASLTIPAETGAGTYYILFVADYDDRFEETNEDNNVEYIEISITAVNHGFDFYISSKQLTSSSTVYAGETMDVSCEHCIEGTPEGFNTAFCYIGYFLSTDPNFDADDIFLDKDLSGLGADVACKTETATLTVPSETDAGIYYILFVADYDEFFDETNENNNVESISITVNVPSSNDDDFYISSQEATTSTTLQAGTSIAVICEQCYAGTSTDAELGNCLVGYFFSTDTLYDLSDIYLDDNSSGLGSDDQCNTETETLTIPTGTSTGTYYILFVADYDEQFAETNEENNTTFIEIQINTAPVADAGLDQTVNEGDYVALNGSGSHDKDGDKLSFLWTAPEGIYLNSTSVANPAFTAPEVEEDTTYTFTLVVHDGMQNSQTDEVSIMVMNSSGVAANFLSDPDHLVKVYPNPSKKNEEIILEFNAETQNLKDGCLTLSTVNGQLLFRKTKLHQEMKISGLPEGLYMIQITFSDHRQVTKKQLVE